MNNQITLPEGKHIVLFDGVCNFCNDTVRFIMKRDKNDLYRYASLQSELGQYLLDSRGIDTNKIDSIVLFQPGIAYYIKSDAALQIAKNLNGLYPVLSLFIHVPSWFRNIFYDIIARNRYKWFGKKEACPIPSSQEKDKFLDF